MNKLSRRLTGVALSTFFAAGAYLVVLAPGVWAKGNAQAGKSLFDGKCAMCHSQDGSGNSPMGKSMKVPNLQSKEVQKQTDAQLYDIIAKGKKMMPQYASQLSKEQINDLVAYIRELGSKKK